MGVSLQTHRMRIGIFGQRFSNGKTKSSHKETFKDKFKSPLFLLLVFNMLLIISVLHSELVPTVFLLCPLRTTCSTWSLSWTPRSTVSPRSSTTLATAHSSSGPLLQSMLNQQLNQNLISVSLSKYCSQPRSTTASPPWTTPPWPSQCPLLPTTH